MFHSTVLALIASSFLAGPISGQTGPDNVLPGGTQVDPAGLGYSINDLLGEIGSMYGSDAQVATEAALDGAVVGEIKEGDLNSAEGAHDTNTIGIQSVREGKAVGIKEAAGFLKHEAEHRQNASSAGTRTDPTTSIPLCGDCNHAAMHFKDVATVSQELCEQLALTDPDKLADLCNHMRNNMDSGNAWMDRCACATSPEVEAEATAQKSAAQNRMNNCCGS